jgi:hypothetical protein
VRGLLGLADRACRSQGAGDYPNFRTLETSIPAEHTFIQRGVFVANSTLTTSSEANITREVIAVVAASRYRVISFTDEWITDPSCELGANVAAAVDHFSSTTIRSGRGPA